MIEDTLIVVPARLASTRLARKMLADIEGEPVILRTYKRAIASNAGDVIVACDCEEIADIIRKNGGTAILTDPELPSGTDRVYSAYTEYDKCNKYKYIVNLQGDLPFVAPEFVRAAVQTARDFDCDIATPATRISDTSYTLDSVVKIAIAFSSKNSGFGLYFSRSPIPFGGPYYNHVGIYCFKSEALKKFVSLDQGKLEKSERLEQLRALENGMTIGVAVLDIDSPISVDTISDLEKARKVAM